MRERKDYERDGKIDFDSVENSATVVSSLSKFHGRIAEEEEDALCVVINRDMLTRKATVRDGALYNKTRSVRWIETHTRTYVRIRCGWGFEFRLTRK